MGNIEGGGFIGVAQGDAEVLDLRLALPFLVFFFGLGIGSGGGFDGKVVAPRNLGGLSGSGIADQATEADR